MTLMPVSRISTTDFCSSKAGAFLWMQSRSFSAEISPSPSMGSPSALNILPRVHLPTGTLMPLPVAMTSMPRAIPSLPAIIMHLTVLAPICASTSMT